MTRTAPTLALLTACALFLGPAPAPAQDSDEAKPGLDEDRLVELIEESVRAQVRDELGLGKELAEVSSTGVESASAARDRSRLNNQRVSLRFDKTPFPECLDFLHDVSGINVVLSAQARASHGAAEVTLRLKGIKLRNALELLLEQVSEDLVYGFRHGVLWIGLRGEGGSRMVLRFYYVADLLHVPKDYPAPRVGLKGMVWGD